jgi:peptidyl-lysine (3S)-dioxygenase / protease
MEELTLEQAVAKLIKDHGEYNASKVEELLVEPSPLEFMRFVHANRPFVVRGGCSDWKAVKKWNEKYLERMMWRQPVQVAITPHG